MTTTLDSRTGAAGVLAAVRTHVPEIRARADEIESARRVPTDLVERLRDAGCFALLLPAAHGGLGADLATAMPVIEELSIADASVAWIVLVGGGVWVDLVGLPLATFDEIYGSRGRTIVAGVFNPTGTISPRSEGYQVSGRWTFASGCEHADWIYGNCIDASGDAPELRVAVFRPEDVEIVDTWSTLGLCGTGSHDIVVHDVTVPKTRTAAILTDPPSVDSPLARIPVPSILAVMMAAVPMGIARAALDDITDVASGKVPLLASTALGADPVFQHHLAAADARLGAVRARLYEAAEEAWAAATEGPEAITPTLRARLRATAVDVTATARDVVEFAYRAGGSTSLFRRSPLQRRLRDVFTVGQHFLLRPDALTTSGAVLAGQHPELTIF
jgi:alkylation response protein AidB-like acyl-CoA dehydrogenase